MTIVIKKSFGPSESPRELLHMVTILDKNELKKTLSNFLLGQYMDYNKSFSTRTIKMGNKL